MLNFEKPTYKITEYVENKNYGKFELEPLERGFGTTLGNALRRIMLSSMPGSAIVAVKIDGVMHEFQTIDGVVEDVTTIVLNLKNVVVKNNTQEVKIIKLYADQEGVVTAADIETDADVEVISKDQVIATLAKGGKLDMEIMVANGRGYVPSNENKSFIDNEKKGFIPIDAIYSPIERVSYETESARVGQDANYDKLIMEVFTNGSLRPEEAMALAAKIMIEHLNIVTNLSEIADITGIMNAKQEDNKLKKLETSIDDLDFSVRAYNCLKRAGVNTLGDLTSKSELEMMKIRNLGKKSLKEVIDKIKEMGLKFREDD
jgi:DNA-directed RNA polymerase subunit alpha